MNEKYSSPLQPAYVLKIILGLMVVAGVIIAACALMWLIAPLVGMRRRFVARNVGYPIYYNNERSKLELGIHYRQPSETFSDHIRQIVADGLL